MKRALVLSLICVVGLAFAGFAQALTGTWTTDICLNPQTDSFAGAISITSTLGVTYAIGDWAFTSTSVLGNAGWTDQDFSVTGLFGLIDVTSALGFNPATPAFESWVTTLILNMAGVEFTGVFTLVPGAAQLDLGMVAGIGSAVEGSIDIQFGDSTGDGCGLDFQNVSIGLDWLFCDCAEIESTIYFTCDGFEYVEFATTGIAIPTLPWLTLSATLRFELQTKEITITPVFDIGPIVCFDLFFDLDSEAAQTYPGGFIELEAIVMTGIGIGCTIGDVEFYALSMFDGSLFDTYHGVYYEIWEIYSIDVSSDACCGGLFDFGLDVYFEDADTLFDVAFFEADMSVNVTEDLKFTMDLAIDVDGGFTEWCVGFEVTW